MRILGLTRVRNEATILQETLDHFEKLCDCGIVVYDDCSEDDTPNIAFRHPATVRLFRSGDWRTNRLVEEYRLRQILLEAGRKFSPDWFLYFDADERVEWEPEVPRGKGYDAVCMNLFDAYITEEDRDVVGTDRKWFGPEYREIVMLYRNLPRMRYWRKDQRIVDGFQKVYRSGFVKHYGKAVSIQEWEDTCDYYVRYFPEPYKSKWAARKGKAVHTKSDFGRELSSWEWAKAKGICIGSVG